MRELSLHILDIAENCVTAKADLIRISVTENIHSDRISFSVSDNGSGMSEDMVALVSNPFVTSRTTRKVGLGLPFLKATAEACNGGLTINSVLNKGTKINCWFQRSHINRMPLGDIITTITMLVIGYPDIHWIFRYDFNDAMFEFDDEFFKSELGDISLSEPSIISFLRDHLRQGIEGAQAEIYPLQTNK